MNSKRGKKGSDAFAARKKTGGSAPRPWPRLGGRGGLALGTFIEISVNAIKICECRSLPA